MVNINEVYIYGDQPTTCPKCGRRTEIVVDLYFTVEKTQLHKCKSKRCEYEFILQVDI